MQESEKPPGHPTAIPEFSRRNRLAAVLIANIAAALVYQVGTFILFVRGSRGATPAILFGQSLMTFPFFLVIFLLVSGVPAFALLSLMLRKFVPPLYLMSGVGVLAGICVLAIVASLMTMSLGFGPIMGMELAPVFLPFAATAGAAGGAACWCYLEMDQRRRQALSR